MNPQVTRATLEPVHKIGAAVVVFFPQHVVGWWSYFLNFFDRWLA